MADTKPLVYATAASVRSDDGMVSIDTWVKSPTPSTARPYHPSVVTWMRGMGEDEANGVIDMSNALRAHDADFYIGRREPSLAVVRAYQVLHKEPDIPKDILGNFGGEVPKLKGVHYYALSQIVRSSNDCTRVAPIARYPEPGAVLGRTKRLATPTLVGPMN